MYFNSSGSQQCIVTISCDSGWTGIPDVRYDEAGTSGEGGGGGDDDEDDISFLGLFSVSYIQVYMPLLSLSCTLKQIDNNHSPVIGTSINLTSIMNLRFLRDLSLKH